MTEKLYEYVAEFRGSFPDVPIPENIIAGIKETDEKPFYVTLPIGKVGGYSQNRKLPYTRDEVQQVVNEVNAKKPEGRVGHIPMKERASKLPDMQWLGAVLEGDIAWGKAYVYRRAEDVRDYLHTQVLANARVGTSIFGEAKRTDGGAWQNINVQAIDLSGHPDGISVQDLRSIPVVTAETINDEEDNMSENQFIQELTASRDDYRDKARDAETKVSELTVSVSELTRERDELKALVAELNLGETPVDTVKELKATDEKYQAVLELVGEGKDPVKVFAELNTRVAEANESVLTSAIEKQIAEMVKVEKLQPTVKKHIELLRKVGDVTDEESAKKAIQEFIDDEDNKELAQSLVSEMSGGRVIVGAAPASDAYSKAGFVSFDDSMKELGG